MEALFTFHRKDPPGDHYMVVASRDEWADVLKDLDGIGHSPATHEMIEELKNWGVTR
jgi:hypothetical protein